MREDDFYIFVPSDLLDRWPLDPNFLLSLVKPTCTLVQRYVFTKL